MKLETPIQTRNAIDEIQRLTGWSHGQMSMRAEIPQSTISRIMTGKIAEPREKQRKKIWALLCRVRKMKALPI